MTKIPQHLAEQQKQMDLVRDAERYRWLKRQHNSPHCGWHVRNNYTGLAANNIPDDLDSEIDKAMK